MIRDHHQNLTPGARTVHRVTAPVAGWVISCLLALNGMPLAAADSTPNACDLDGTANAPCSIEVQLDNRVLTQALPFDVPVFLKGTATSDIKRLVLHIFSARDPFRVERTCNQPGVSFENCPPDNRELACHQESSGRGREETAWSYSALEKSSISSKVSCLLEPRVSTWNRANDADNNFVLRVPPEPANRYFHFLLEIGRIPTPAQKSRVEAALELEIAKAIAERKRNAAPSFEEWAAKLRQDLCAALERVGAQENVRFETEADSLLSCAPGKMADLPAKKAHLLTFLSSISDIIEQARTLEQVRTGLAAKRAQLPILAGTQPVFGLTTSALASSSLDVTPLLVSLEDVEELDQEITGANTQGWSSTDLALLDQARQAVDFLKASAADYHQAVVPAASITRDLIALQGSNIGSFLTRQKSYIAADFGILYSTDVEQALPYIGTSVYLIPVNKQAPLKGWSPRKRLGLTIGITVGKFDNDRAEPLFSSMNMLLGGGFRVTESIRVGGGAVLFREADRDPLSNAKKLVYSPYASVSFDYDVQSLIKWFNRIFPGGS